jgi:hypothetical protein
MRIENACEWNDALLLEIRLEFPRIAVSVCLFFASRSGVEGFAEPLILGIVRGFSTEEVEKPIRRVA